MDKGRHCQRRYSEARPQPCARKVASLSEPGQCDRQDRTEGNRDGHQRHCVEQQFSNSGTPQQAGHCRPARTHGDFSNEAKRQESCQRDEECSDLNP